MTSYWKHFLLLLVYLFRKQIYVILQGDSANKKYALKLPTFRVIVGVSPTGVHDHGWPPRQVGHFIFWCHHLRSGQFQRKDHTFALFNFGRWKQFWATFCRYCTVSICGCGWGTCVASCKLELVAWRGGVGRVGAGVGRASEGGGL